MFIKIIEEIDENIQGRSSIEMDTLGIDKNHIHLFSSFYPKISPGGILRIFKSTLRGIFKKHQEIKKDLLGGEFWPNECYLATIGERGNWLKME